MNGKAPGGELQETREKDAKETVTELDSNPTSRPGKLPRCGDGGEGWAVANIVVEQEHPEFGRNRSRSKK